MRYLSLLLLPFILYMAGCDLLGEDNEPEPEVVSNQAADFGFRAIFGLNPNAVASPKVFAVLLYNQENERIFVDDERVYLAFNDTTVTNGEFILDGLPFEYKPGARYQIEVGLNGKTVDGAITAPSISDIQIVSLPDTLCDNAPLTIKWAYPEGEQNDGTVMVTANGYTSDHLDPGTTSHTIPAGTFSHGYWGDQELQVMSIRSVLYPKLYAPVDLGVQFGMGYSGSFFSTFIMSEVHRLYVQRSDFEAECN